VKAVGLVVAVLVLAACHPALVPATADDFWPELVVALELSSGHQAPISFYCVSVMSLVDGREVATAASGGFVDALNRQSAAHFRTGSACTDEDAELTVGIQSREASGTVQVKGGVTCGSLCGWGFTAILSYQYRQHRWVMVRPLYYWRS
jgi:hypothetical protein